jgi:hypothetical protein
MLPFPARVLIVSGKKLRSEDSSVSVPDVDGDHRHSQEDNKEAHATEDGKEPHDRSPAKFV